MQEETVIVGERFYEKLKRLTLVRQLNWENYYIDKLSNEKWIEEYPHSEMHGGGPPQLRLIDKFPWDNNDDGISN